MYFRKAVIILFTSLMLTACATTGGSTTASKKQSILSMKNQVLDDLYSAKPSIRTQIAKAPGYAVFSNANINVIFASFGGGYGVVKNNRSGQHTYMKMGELGLGLGLGIKDFRVVFIFHDKDTMHNFVENGWAFGAHADAAAKASNKGGAVGGEAILDNISVYQLTESGLALQATLKGTKYWKYEL